MTGVLFVVLFVLFFTISVPYVVLSPGPTFNTLGGTGNGHAIIKISGTPVNKTSGHLNLTTVGVTTGPVTPYQAFTGWLRGSEIVVPRSAVYPPDQTTSQTNRQNTQDFVQSQDNATAAALCQLGYPHFGVVHVLPKGPAAGKLRAGDAIRSIDGTSTDTAAQLKSALQGKKIGQTVTVGVIRHKSSRQIDVTLGRTKSTGDTPALGVTITDSCVAPFTVDLGLANEIGGPSAGLMFALGIVDKVGDDNLTDGRFIAGTGTITPQGSVGPIGGIQLKMIAARDKGASVFLAPGGNCSDVRGNIPSGLQVVKVTSLKSAIRDLDRLERHQGVPHC